jgi:hypothetical protein
MARRVLSTATACSPYETTEASSTSLPSRVATEDDSHDHLEMRTLHLGLQVANPGELDRPLHLGCEVPGEAPVAEIGSLPMLSLSGDET